MPQQSRFQRFWSGWRKDIIRGAVIFAAILGVGLAVSNMSGKVPFRFGEHGGFDFGDFDLDNRSWVESFRWAGTVSSGGGVWIRNLNGPVSVEPSEGDSIIVTAEKSWRNSDPDGVRFVTVPSDGAVTICALWEADEETCGERGTYSVNKMRRSDVAVRFLVLLPRDVMIDVKTVNGRLDVAGATGSVTVETVNGGIEATTSKGPITASTVNGGIEVRMRSLAHGGVSARTVNGSITAALSRGIDADLDAQTVSGRVNTDFPVQMVGRISSRHVKAKIGSGGQTVNLRTVNGSINIEELQGDTHVEPVTPPVPATPPTPARPARRAQTAAHPR